MTRPEIDVDYVLPLRWDDDKDLADLTKYLKWLSERVRIIVVDGSRQELFSRHDRAWRSFAEHVGPAPVAGLNGKVVGVHTGMMLATASRVIIADDDVRYDDVALDAVVTALDHADLVGPQNVFRPMPWHAAWDTSRTLLNRALAADYPGTFAIRRTMFEQMDGYSPDVLFENLELMRTVKANGGSIRRPLHVFVTRRPSTVSRFFDQRVRQAYDDLAQPWRLLAFLPILPAALSGRRGRKAVATLLASSVGLAEIGRRRGGGTEVFPMWCVAFAPAWLGERALCIWIAVLQRVLLGGVRYSGQRLATAAHSSSRLRSEAATRRPLVTTGRAEAAPVGPVAERLQGRTTAATERDDCAPGIDVPPIHIGNAELPTHDQRPVGVRRDTRHVVGVASSLVVAHDEPMPDLNPH
jgi:hypothetical protein